jgi:hypothetical protein
MALIALALVAGVVAGRVLGGRLRHLSGARLRSAGLLMAGAACEFAGSRWGSGAVGTGLLVAGYVLLLGFALRNLALTGMVLVGFGLLANLAVISLNQGMPVRGLPPGVRDGPRHHGERPGDRLTSLADVVRLGPLGETVSPGDIVLSVGVATVMAGVMRSPRRSIRADVSSAPR